MMSSSAPLRPVLGLYGKIPAERDYVRINAGEFQQAGMDKWFQEGVECLHTEGTRLPEEPAHFVLLAPGGSAFIGCLRPGEDRVGRSFPLIIAMHLEIAPGPDALPLLPAIFAPFFAAAAQLAEQAKAMGTQALAAQVEGLRGSLGRSAELLSLDELLARSSFFELRVAVGGYDEGAAYALHTMVTSCRQAQEAAAGAAKRTVTVDCPTPTDGMRIFWLELVRRLLGSAPVMPSLLWTASRLLVALGPPPAQILAYLANPEHKSSRYWPLRTNSPAANVKAGQGLSAEQQRLLGSGQVSLAGVLAAFTPQ